MNPVFNIVFNGLRLRPIVLLFAVSLVQAHTVNITQDVEPEGELARGELEFRLPAAGIRAYSLNDFSDFKAVLLVEYPRETCGPTHKNLESDLEALQKQQNSKLKVILIDSSLYVNRMAIERERSKDNFHSIYLYDVLQRVSQKFSLHNAGDFVLIEPKRPQVLISGSLSELAGGKNTRSNALLNWSEFKHGQSLAELKPCKIPIWQPSLNSVSENSANQFSEMFLQPFSRQCLSCHIKSEQFEQFKTLAQTIVWAKMSLRTIDTLRMPGRRDPYFDSDDGGLAALEDLRRITYWLENKINFKDENQEQNKLFAAEYNRLRALRSNSETNDKLALTLRMKKTLEVPAIGSSKTNQVLLGEPIERPLVVTAAFLSANLNVLHHANLLAFPPGQVLDNFESTTKMSSFLSQLDLESPSENKLITKTSGWIQNLARPFYKVQEPILFTFSRRTGIIHLAPGLAYELQKGSQLAAQLHFEPSGRDDKLEIEFKVFEKSTAGPYFPLKRFTMTPLKAFSIKPGQKSYVVEARYKTKKRIFLSTVWFHAHYRAVGMRIQIENKSGFRDTIFSDPFHQLKMESAKTFDNRGLEIPAGSTLITQVEYDNSKNNLANPDASQKVILGGSTFDSEMHYPGFVYSED